MGLWISVGDFGKAEADAEGEGAGLQAGEGAVEETRAVADAVAARVKGIHRDEQELWGDVCAVAWAGDAVAVGIHLAVGRPLAEGEWSGFGGDDGQGGLMGGMLLEPGADGFTKVGFAAIGPAKTDVVQLWVLGQPVAQVVIQLLVSVLPVVVRHGQSRSDSVLAELLAQLLRRDRGHGGIQQ